MSFPDVTEIATDYAKKAGYSWVKVLRVLPNEKDKIWEVDIDVGVLSQEIKKVNVEDSSGRIISYG